jgi:hypothetical protein
MYKLFYSTSTTLNQNSYLSHLFNRRYISGKLNSLSDERQFFFTEECHLIKVEGMTELENHKFSSPNETDCRELDIHIVPKC